MWAGTSALKSIDQTVQTVRNETIRLDGQLSNLTDSLAANQRRKLAIINQIASIRLSEMEKGDLLQTLSLADNQALETLGLRKVALTQIQQKIDTLNQRVVETETEREGLLDKVNALSQNLIEAEAKVQAQLKEDPIYRAQFDKASAASVTSQEAERKVAQSHDDMSAKALPYQRDSLFMYLWEQKFGTTEYKGRLFTRYMDSWLARLIKYEPSRVNYWNLTEIPKRLTEHAELVGDIAEAEHDALQALELTALDAAGVAELDLKIVQAHEVLDLCDDRIESIEGELTEVLAKRANFTSGDDAYIKKSLKILASSLEHQSLHAIHRYVLATYSPTDDQLVLELHEIQEQVEDVNDDLRDVRNLHANKLSKLTELEGIRRNFKSARYDDVRSGFSNESLLVGVLGQFVQGLVNGSDVWNTIKRNQRYRTVDSSPDFGSGALAEIGGILIGAALDEVQRGARRKRSTRRSSWNLPRSRSGGGSEYRKPRSKRGGGFKTGGGF